MSRTPAELAREVRDAIISLRVHAVKEQVGKSDDGKRREARRQGRDALAALAELQAQAEAGRDERDRADRYEFALATLHADGEGGFVTPLCSEQEVVEDCIRVANERRRAAAAPSPADQQKCECGAPADNISFERSICACGSMHYFCAECGAQAEPCGDYTEEPSA